MGDEGGFAPDLASDEEAIEYILEAVKQAGYEPGRDFVLAMDAASSEWKGSKKESMFSRNAEEIYFSRTCGTLEESGRKVSDLFY